VWVHSFTPSYIPRSIKCDSRASLLARTFASPCLGYKGHNNILIGLTFTIIGTYQVDHFVKNPNKSMTIGRRFQSSDSKVVIDVHVVLLEPRQKMNSRMSKPTHP